MRENGGGELIALKSSLQQEATPFTHTHTLTDGRTAVCDILPFQSDDFPWKLYCFLFLEKLERIITTHNSYFFYDPPS